MGEEAMSQHIAKPGARIDFRALTGSDERPQHRRRFAAIVAAEEGPVVAVMYDRT